MTAERTPVETLREAARRLREDANDFDGSDEVDTRARAFATAVADLLDREAMVAEQMARVIVPDPGALAVARAYLGEA